MELNSSDAEQLAQLNFNSPRVLLEQYYTIELTGGFIDFNSPRVLLELHNQRNTAQPYADFNSPRVLLEHNMRLRDPDDVLYISILLESYWNLLSSVFLASILCISILLESYWNQGAGGTLAC